MPNREVSIDVVVKRLLHKKQEERIRDPEIWEQWQAQVDALNQRAPDNQMALYFKGLVYLSQKEPELAREFYHNALQKQSMDPKYQAEIYADLARVEFRFGNYEESEAALRHAIKLNPKEGIFHHLLGQLYEHQGKDAWQYRHYSQALDLLKRQNPRLATHQRYLERAEKDKKRSAPTLSCRSETNGTWDRSLFIF